MVKRNRYWFLFVVVFVHFIADGQQSDFNEHIKQYIETYKAIAIEEMKVYRIPASITLAQGIHESRAGQSPLAVNANNHFGIKCHKDWFGKTYYEHDDDPNECFRKYDNPLESFRDHSYFLSQRDRYKGLFTLEITDYKGWARGLKSAGYATNPKYAENLIRLIETFSLYQYDQPGFIGADLTHDHDLDDPAAHEWLRRFMLYAIGPNNRRVYSNNELQMTIARREDNLKTLSRDFRIPVKRLMKYNDLKNESALEPGQIVYLEPKRRKAAVATHAKSAGESLYHISQFYGIKLKMVYKRNKLRELMEPSPGSILKLR
ncbi:MAG: glucosaminidase domain-containing protein [Bacteroidota bacterium]